ncbi:unnamed protein product, partial [Gongylonema pulchrum]|uniref:TITIN protein n=1 Tax=Gongylonema pulchrum TaxID=637853 RepID=A0A183CW55_9BILA
VPGVPENGQVVDIGTDCATIRWDAPSDDGGSAITGYVVEKKEASRRAFHRFTQVSGTTLMCVIDELEMNTAYIVRIAAINKYGTGEFMELSRFQTATPFSAPTVQRPPNIRNITSESCTLEWPEVQLDGGSPIYGYDVFMRKDKAAWIKLNEELLFTRQFTVSNIQPGPVYEFKIEATNEAGLTSSSNIPSEPLIISAAAEELPVLAVPMVEVVSSDTVRLQWTEVAVEKCNVTSFVVKYKSEKGSVWSEKETEHSPLQIDGLKEGVSYLFKVAAKSGPTVGEFSEETVPIRVVAARKPEITKGIKDTSVSCKRELRLECHAVGEPIPEYIWSKDGNEIVPADDNVEIVNEGYMSVFLIHHTTMDDAGLYTCEVANDLGSVHSDAVVTVTEVRAHFTTSFPEYLEVDEGSDAIFSCELSDADASVIWLKDGRAIVCDNRLVIEQEDVERRLTIRNARPEDCGEYECATADKKSRTQAELVVKEEEAQIKQGPQDQVVTEFGTTLVLTCETTKPVKSVKWFKNGKEIWSRFQKYAMSVQQSVATLEVYNFEASDQGEYSVALREDERSAPAKVELKVVPFIKLTEDMDTAVMKLHAGSDFAFELAYEGFPEPTAEATLNEQSVDIARFRMHTYDDKLSVRLRNLTKQDSGSLKIIMENVAGRTSKEIQLDVLDLPTEPLNLTYSDLTSRSVMLRWERPREDGGSPINSYIIERKTTGIQRWRSVGKCEPQQCMFLAEELYPSESYGFRIIAVNEVGEGPPSTVVDVFTKSESFELAELAEEARIVLQTPSRPEATLSADNRIVLLTWRLTEGADEYIVERSERDNEWKQIGVSTEPNFEDSVDEDLSYMYRIIAKKGEHESSPSEPTIQLTVQLPDLITEAQVPKDEAAEVGLKEVPETVEEWQLIEEEKAEKLEAQAAKPEEEARPEKVPKKKKKSVKKVTKDEVKGKLEADEQEVRKEMLEKADAIKKEQEKLVEEVIELKREIQKEETEKFEVEVASEKIAAKPHVEEQEQVAEEAKKIIEEKAEAEKKREIPQKKKRKKTEVKPEDEKKPEKQDETEKEKEKVEFRPEAEKEQERPQEQKRKKSEAESEAEKKAEVETTPEERPFEKVVSEEELEKSFERKKLEREKSDAEKMLEEKEIRLEEAKAAKELETEGEKKAKPEKKMAKKKEGKKVARKDKREVKLEEPAMQVQLGEAEVEKKLEKREKLAVRPVESCIKIAYGTENVELKIEIRGECTKCWWTKDANLLDDEHVETTTSSSVLRIGSVDET